MMEGAGRKKKLIPWLFLAGLLLIHLVFFGRSVNYAAVWDDRGAILNNPKFEQPLYQGLHATQLQHLGEELKQLSGLSHAHDSYRPLLYLSYKIDQSLWGFTPRYMHLHNLVIALLSILMCFIVAKLWLDSAFWALLPTALFALHPFQVEATVYISARGDLLAGLFALTAMAIIFSFTLPNPPKISCAPWANMLSWFLGGLFFLLSLLCKEAYWGLPVVICLALFIRGRLRHEFLGIAWLCFLSGIYLLFRLNIVDSHTGAQGMRPLGLLPELWMSYIMRFLLPFDLSTGTLHGLGPGAIWGWAFLLSIMALGLWGWLKRDDSWADNLLNLVFGLLAALVLLAPSIIATLIYDVAADRYIYLPLWGMALALTYSIRISSSHVLIYRTIWAAGGAWALMLLYVTNTLIPSWKDNLSLYLHAVNIAPQSPPAQYRLGYIYAKRQAYAQSVKHLQKVLTLAPDHFQAMNNLGVVYMNTGQLDQAQELFLRVLKIRQGHHHRAHYNLGMVRALKTRNPSQACHDMRRALQENPRYPQAHTYLSQHCRRAEVKP